MSLSSYITILLILLVAAGGWYWLDQYEENVIIHILSGGEEELALPVYAQFVVTQSLVIKEKSEVVRLKVPVYFPDKEKRLRIDLLRQGRLLQRWRYRPREAGAVNANLKLRPPRRLEGKVEVQFSATNIDHEHAGQAPGLFTESADQQYPHGNYRIADNDKKGDVSLKVVERRRVLDREKEEFQKRPLAVLSRAGLLLLAALLIITIPGVLKRTVVSR